MLEKTYSGAGGGGKGGRSPDVADVSGTSTDYANVLMALGEGQVEGIIGGGKGFYLDDTPLINDDGTTNFKNLSYYFSPGTLDQPGIPAEANEVSSETSVGVEVTQSIPVTRTFINNEVSAIRVRIGVRLQKQQEDGDVGTAAVRFRIFIKEGNGGAFVNRLETKIDGRYTDLTVFQYLFYVNNAGGTIDEFSIRIEKLSTDAVENEQRDLQFLSFSEVIFTRLEYPNTAIAWVQFPSKLFKSVPKISVDMGGILFPIPTNATVDPNDGGLNFSGGWNGAFYTPAIAPADPAWILYGILTNTRFGLGRFVSPDKVDKWAFYEASVYNNQFVNNGFSGTERRFLFNGIIQGDQDAWEVITAICSNMSAKPFWDGSAISIWQDRPSPVIGKQFTNADVEEGRFVYTSNEWKSVATVAKVSWSDPQNNYEPTVELIEDPIGMNKYGVHYTDFTAMGCTSRGQAVRAGRRVLLSTRLDSEQVSFKARAFAVYCKPGDIIQVSDARRNRARKGGLIREATTTTITLDAPVTLVGSGSSVFVTMPDLTIQSRTITNGAGTHATLTMTSPLPAAPLSHSNWIIQDGAAVPKKYRVLSVAPDKANPTLYEIVGLLYQDKYTQIENGWQLEPLPINPKPPTIVPLPRNVAATGRMIVGLDGSVSYTLDVSWDYPLRNDGTPETFVTAYLVEIKRGETGTWGNRQRVSGLSARYENVGSGSFYARVAAITIEERYSNWVDSTSASAFGVQAVADFSNASYSVLSVDF